MQKMSFQEWLRQFRAASNWSPAMTAGNSKVLRQDYNDGLTPAEAASYFRLGYNPNGVQWQSVGKQLTAMLPHF